jgi:uncharacterized membrane protein YraQ (UPF0718 family)
MTTTMLDPPAAPAAPRSWWRRWFDPNTTAGRRRLLGVALFAVLFAFFFSFNRFPKLDTVREDVEIATSAASRTAVEIPALETRDCFQGFCVEPAEPFVERWWNFSITYLEAVTVGMIFAFAVAGLVQALLLPKDGSFGNRHGLVGSLQGMATGAAMNLCSACIVPVANSVRKQGGGIETTVSITQGSSTLNGPALIMLFAIFTPMLAGTRVLLSLAGALLLGPLVARAVQAKAPPLPQFADRLAITEQAGAPQPWHRVIVEGGRDWLQASWSFFIRLAPIMIVAGFISGAAIQLLTPDIVERLLGNHALGIVLAATFGVLINVPLLFEIPLVAALMLLGMGTAPAAVLLFTAAAGGPITFWGLAKVIPARGVAALAGGTWVIGALGGIALLAMGSPIAQASAPTITFDGTDCSYRGPATLPAESVEFVVRNEAVSDNPDISLGVLVGRIERPLHELEAQAEAFPNAHLPSYFKTAGERQFIFSDSAEILTVPFHRAGTYAISCAYGGSAFVVREFSMRQSPGWFDEYRGLFANHIAPQTILVED